MAIGSSGMGGGGSSATGSCPTDDDVRSGGGMAETQPLGGTVNATPGAERAQGGTITGACAIPTRTPIQRRGPIQRHHTRTLSVGSSNSTESRLPAEGANYDPRDLSPPPYDDSPLRHPTPPLPDEPPGSQTPPRSQTPDPPDDGLPFGAGDQGLPQRPHTPLDYNRTFPGPPRRRATGGKKRTKASVLVATLNIRGIGNPNPWHPGHKWNHVNQFTKANKTGILVLTESHLNVARHTRIQTLFGRRLEVLFSEDPVTPNAKGVAFVINKDLLDTDNMRTWEIVPGRAMLLEIETHKGENSQY
ncbi:hypothetical protein C8R44DRAFT_742750 [Mycena epipterygia]|nr:hypothetical protein C8R44DRAFT_742750 [Mycena epipterygia]